MIRLLALLCLLFTAAIAAEMLSTPAATPHAAPPAHPLATASSHLAVATRAARNRWLEDVLARPLFAPDRRPAAGAIATDPGLPRLAGIIASSDGTLAIFQPAGDAKPVLARHGDRIGGWQVASVEPDKVTLEKAGERVVLNPRFAETSATGAGGNGTGATGVPPIRLPAVNRR